VNTELKLNRNLTRWISLGVGALALLVGLIATIVGPLNPTEVIGAYKTVSYVAFGIAALGLVAFVLLDPQSLAAAVTGRTGQYAITTWVMALAFTAFVIAIFIILRKAAIAPADLTAAQKYQMSDQTKQILKGLKDDVHVVAFYPDTDSTGRKDAQLWLDQYATLSNGKITFEFVDPDKNPGTAKELGMSRASSMVFKRGDQKSEASSATEQDMTNALLHVLSGQTRNAYVISGHGERGLADFQPAGISQMQTLLENANFKVQDLNLLQQKQIPADAKVVILPGPTTPLLPAEVDALNAYLDKGGGLIFMIDAGTFTSDDPLIKSLNDKWGVSLRDDVVIDLFSQQYTGDGLTPLIFNFDESSPITQGMRAGGRRILMSTARSLVAATTAPADTTVTSLLSTADVSGSSWGETHFQVEQQTPQGVRQDAKDTPGPLTLAASADNAKTKGRVVVFGDSDFADNQLLTADKYNGDLILNSANWLSHKEDLITLPAPSDIGQRSLSKLTSLPLLIIIGISASCLIPLIMFGAGIAVWIVRRRRR
jgi:ABC-type uncharacterized transport system involved in gliding motility auxiliary subunit